MGILSKTLIFSFFLFSIFYFLFSVTPVYAASQANPSPTVQQPTPNTNPDVPNNTHYITQNTVIEIMAAISCQISGIDPLNPKGSCLGADPKTGKVEFAQNNGGAIGAMNNMITMLYTPPIHTSDYLQNLAQNFGISKKTYAQESGIGFKGLIPLLGLWTAFRNIVYLVFVIVFVVIGLAIMLRVKIDPRTVMTIQNQIPKIIIGILLVTFSYAIAGFLVDMMYVTIHVTGNIIASTDKEIDPATTTNISTATNPFAAANKSVSIGTAFKTSTAIGGEFKDMLETPGGRILSSIVGGIAGNFIISAIPDKASGGVVGGLAKSKGFLSKLTEKIALATGTAGAAIGTVLLPGAGTALGTTIGVVVGQTVSNLAVGAAVGALIGPYVISGITTLIVFLILAIAMLTALFRLWFILLLAYVHILLNVVLAPFWIIGGIIPGSSININGWFRDTIANLAAFPVVIAMFLLGKVFQDAIGDGNITNFVPPLIGDRLSPDAIKGFISLGIILITPNVLNIIKTALKVPKVDTGLGKAIGAGPALAMNVGKNIGGTLTGAEEAVMRKQPGGGYDWGERGIGRTLVGKIFGR